MPALFTFRLPFQGGKIEVTRFLFIHTSALADDCLLLLRQQETQESASTTLVYLESGWSG